MFETCPRTRGFVLRGPKHLQVLLQLQLPLALLLAAPSSHSIRFPFYFRTGACFSASRRFLSSSCLIPKVEQSGHRVGWGLVHQSYVSTGFFCPDGQAEQQRPLSHMWECGRISSKVCLGSIRGARSEGVPTHTASATLKIAHL